MKRDASSLWVLRTTRLPVILLCEMLAHPNGVVVLLRILARYRLHPEEWAEDERYDPMWPDAADVERRVVVPFLEGFHSLSPMEKYHHSSSFFLAAAETMQPRIMAAVLDVLDPEAKVYLPLLKVCAILGIPKGSDIVQRLEALPQSVYHEFTNTMLRCIHSDIGPDVLDPSILILCSGNPAVTSFCQIRFPASDPLACRLFFDCCTKISVGHTITALHALPADFSIATTSAHVALIYRNWSARTFSPVRLIGKHARGADELHIGELVAAMRRLLSRCANASALLGDDLRSRFRIWAASGYPGTFEWSQAGAQLRARLFPNMTTLRSLLLGKEQWPQNVEPETQAPYALHPTGAVLYVTDIFVPPWLDGRALQATFFTAVERQFATPQKRVHFVVVGPVYADTFHALDVRYGWERMVGSEDVYAVCPPRPGDPRREPEYFYWTTPLVRLRVALMHTLLRRGNAVPGSAWFSLTTGSLHGKSTAVVNLCEALETSLTVANGQMTFHGDTRTIWCKLKVLSTRVIVKNLGLNAQWENTLISVVLDFLVQLCRIWSLEVHVDGQALDKLRDSLHHGRLWKPFIERPLPSFSSDGYWKPVARCPSAERPCPREPHPGEDAAATHWVRQREADLNAFPKAQARRVYEY
jgi:hypothetical protein